ncbi:PREDICTED: putative WEB family protein At1g65010, chloroplastic [Nicrophorus vespilloides]|uniref:WEB family protein At1g65010, chloroplastic n=1 Tax=Nicrophorus vespilloides TaxID=110193 RepID=A0ABM1MLZ3_NICVS|nr:PREDICTED: putative WEB family protein At1g65010, chloroplastic [Nicrophorus vespilloides]
MAAKSDKENAENFDSSQQLLFMKAKYDLEKKIFLELETQTISCELAQSNGYKRFLSTEFEAAHDECLKMKQHKELLSVSMMFLQQELDKIVNILGLFQEERSKFQVIEDELQKTFCQHSINYNELNQHIKNLIENIEICKTIKNNKEKLKSALIMKQSILVDCDSRLCDIKLKYNEDVQVLSDSLSDGKLNLNNLIATNDMLKSSINAISEEFHGHNLQEVIDNNTNLKTMLNDHETKSNIIINDLNDKICAQSELYNQALITLNKQENECTEIKKIESDLTISNNQCLTEIEKRLVEVENKNLNFKSEYEKSKTLLNKLKEQNGEIYKKNLVEAAEFNEWKEMYEENIKKTNEDFEEQIMCLQKELSEIKQISRDALETQKESFIDELKDVQINIETSKKELEKLADENSVVEIRYKNAFDRKETLTNLYKSIQDSDENSRPTGILKNNRAEMIPLNSNKNVTFRSNVSYETASQCSVDSFLEEIKRINNSTASPTESVADFKSTNQTRKRNRFD